MIIPQILYSIQSILLSMCILHTHTYRWAITNATYIVDYTLFSVRKVIEYISLYFCTLRCIFITNIWCFDFDKNYRGKYFTSSSSIPPLTSFIGELSTCSITRLKLFTILYLIVVFSKERERVIISLYSIAYLCRLLN